MTGGSYRTPAEFEDKEKDPVLVDLSLDCEVTLPPENLTPANRLNVPGISVQNYFVYSVEDQLADKLCAIMEAHPGGWRSSRMKDLSDVVTYALTQSPSGKGLSAAIANECARLGFTASGKALSVEYDSEEY